MLGRNVGFVVVVVVLRDPQINCASLRACKNFAKGSALGSIRRKSRDPKMAAPARYLGLDRIAPQMYISGLYICH